MSNLLGLILSLLTLIAARCDRTSLADERLAAIGAALARAGEAWLVRLLVAAPRAGADAARPTSLGAAHAAHSATAAAATATTAAAAHAATAAHAAAAGAAAATSPATTAAPAATAAGAHAAASSVHGHRSSCSAAHGAAASPAARASAAAGHYETLGAQLAAQPPRHDLVQRPGHKGDDPDAVPGEQGGQRLRDGAADQHFDAQFGQPPGAPRRRRLGEARLFPGHDPPRRGVDDQQVARDVEDGGDPVLPGRESRSGGGRVVAFQAPGIAIRVPELPRRGSVVKSLSNK